MQMRPTTPVKPTQNTPQKLGEILLQHRAISPKALEAALLKQKQTNKALGALLVADGICTNRQVLHALAEQRGVPSIDLDAETPAPNIQKLLREELSKKHGAIPIRIEKSGALLVA